MFDIGVIFTCLEIDFVMFNTIYFQVFKIPINFQRQDPLPTHVQNIGWPDFDNWEMKSWVWVVSLSMNQNRCPFNLLLSWHQIGRLRTCVILDGFFNHLGKWQIHVWSYTALGDSMYQDWRGGEVIKNMSIYSTNDKDMPRLWWTLTQDECPTAPPPGWRAPKDIK